MMAACHAVEVGCDVVLFEKQKKPGRKILITGNGRCNISNRYLDPERYHGENPSFVHNVFSRFGLNETELFFKDIGIPFLEEGEGRLFPASLQASSVVAMLLYEMEKRGVDLRLHRRIDHIFRKKKRFLVRTAAKEEELFDSIILAAGSCAYSPVGASKSGYELAASMGHRIIAPRPVILPLNIPMKRLHRLQGIKWDVALTVYREKKIIEESMGEVLFSGYGLSGPAALKISRSVNEAIYHDSIPEIAIDFFPETSHQELALLLDELWGDPDREIAFSLRGILKERVPEVICEAAGIDQHRPVKNLTVSEKEKITSCLKGLRVIPGEPRDFKEAVAAAGGVAVDEIDPAGMESKKVPGLFITGELLDIDGDSGGYNLQFAWSTGAIAGLAQGE